MKHQVLFCLKNNEKIFKTVICCSHDWHLKDCYLPTNFDRIRATAKTSVITGILIILCFTSPYLPLSGSNMMF